MSSREMMHTEWTRESTPAKTFETAGKWVEKAIEEDRPWFTFVIDDEGTIAAIGNWSETDAYQEFLGKVTAFCATELATSVSSGS